MKFLPILRPVAMLSLIAALDACSTPANRRELYNTSYSENGPWHDYSRRREAEAQTGINAGTSPSVLPGREGRPTAPPPPGVAVPPTGPAPAAVPDPAPAAPAAPVVAPPPTATTPTDAGTTTPPPP